MDRRAFIQTTGLGVAAAIAGRSPATTLAASPKPPAVKRLPARSEVKPADTWDLSSLFARDADWETAFKAWQKQMATRGYDLVGTGYFGPKTKAAVLDLQAKAGLNVVGYIGPKT